MFTIWTPGMNDSVWTTDNKNLLLLKVRFNFKGGNQKIVRIVVPC